MNKVEFPSLENKYTIASEEKNFIKDFNEFVFTIQTIKPDFFIMQRPTKFFLPNGF